MDFENPVGGNVAQQLNCTTWPANLDPIDLFQLTGSEMYAL